MPTECSSSEVRTCDGVKVLGSRLPPENALWQQRQLSAQCLLKERHIGRKLWHPIRQWIIVVPVPLKAA